MKIDEIKIIKLEDIHMGETFRYKDSVWMRIYEISTQQNDEEMFIPCVNLATGIWELFSRIESITPVNAKVVIE